MCTRLLKSILIGTALTLAAIPVKAQTHSETASAASIGAQTNPANQPLLVEALLEDIDLAEGAFSHIHPGYDRYTDVKTLKEAWDGLRSRAQNGMSQGDFYLELSQVLTLIRCDHTKAELPKALKSFRKEAPVYLPLKWTIRDGRAFVLSSPSSDQLSPGDEILRIDGRDVMQIIKDLAPYIPVDGLNDHIKESLMTASLEHMGGAYDHFGDLLYTHPPTATVDVKSPDGLIRQHRLERVNFDAWKTIAIENSARNFKDAVMFERVGDKGAILRIDTFVNYREPVDPKTIFDPIFESLKNEGRDQLILDLRRNGGGSTDVSLTLLSYLLEDDQTFKTKSVVKTLDLDDYRPFISTWEKRALNPKRWMFKKQEDGLYAIRSFLSDDLKTVKPPKNAFDGQLIALTSRANSSGSTNLLSVLKDARSTTLVGEATGGSVEGPTAGVLFYLKLPQSGITLRLPVIRSYNNVKRFEFGRGLTPDVKVTPDVQSLIQGKDITLEKAIELTLK